MMARLRPGVTPMQAQQALAGTFGEVAKQGAGSIDPKQWKPLLDFVPARGIAGYNDYYREPLQILMGLVALVLLIACTNVAMMMQARNTVRQREFSLRLAVGAGRARIFRQLLAESLLLVSAGAALGWLFALSATRLLASWSGIETGLSPDRNVLLFTLLDFGRGRAGLRSCSLVERNPCAGGGRAARDRNQHNHEPEPHSGRAHRALCADCRLPCSADGRQLLLRTLRNYATENLGMQTEGLLVFGVTPQGQTDTARLLSHAA